MHRIADHDRYFFALWPEPPLRRELSRASERWLGGATRSHRDTAPSRYHLTLLYLGALGPDAGKRLPALLAHLRPQRFGAFELMLDCTGHFGRSVAWIGCSRIPSALLQLRERLVRAAHMHGIDADQARDFVPHVTLARRSGRRWPLSGPLKEPLHWPVREYRLVRSVSADAFAYRTMARLPLAGIPGN